MFSRQIKGGNGNAARSAYSLVASGQTNVIQTTADNSLVGGLSNTINSGASTSMVFGANSTVAASASNSVILGQRATSTAAGSIVISSASANNFNSCIPNGLSARLPGSVDSGTLANLGITQSNNLVAGVRASGTITINAALTVGDQFNINGNVLTAGTHFSLTGNAVTEAANLQAVIDALANITATVSVNVVTVYATTPGTAGNAFVFTTTAGAVTLNPSGGTLSGGTDGTTYKSMFVQGQDTLTVGTKDFFSLIGYTRWSNEDVSTSTNQETIMTTPYMPQKNTNWTGLSIIDGSLNVSPNNVSAALDILAKGLLLSQQAANLFMTTSINGGANGQVVYNNTAIGDYDNDLIIGASGWGTASSFGAIASVKGSFVVGSATGTELNYANIGTGIISAGLNNQVSANYSAAFGRDNLIASGSNQSFAVGANLSAINSSVGSLMFGGGISSDVTVDASSGLLVTVDSLNRTTNPVSVTSQNYINKSVYFNGFSRGSGLASIDATNAAAALTDTTTNEGAREIFRPLHIETIAVSTTVTLDSVFSITATTQFVSARGYVLLSNALNKTALFRVDDLLVTNSAILNNPTIALVYDDITGHSPDDIDFTLVANKLNISIENPSATNAIKANICLYVTDIFSA